MVVCVWGWGWGGGGVGVFFFNDTATTEIYTLSLHDALPIYGEPKIVVVGLPDAAVKESTDRISSALVNSGYRRPAYHTTVNLAPGGLRKEGPSFDQIGRAHV